MSNSLKTWLQAPTRSWDNLRVLGESLWPCENGKIPADSSRCEMRHLKSRAREFLLSTEQESILREARIGCNGVKWHLMTSLRLFISILIVVIMIRSVCGDFDVNHVDVNHQAHTVMVNIMMEA
eukprot:sb/3475797/